MGAAEYRKVRLEVVGLPAPQGSKRHVGNGVMVESSKSVQPWRHAVAWAARAAMGDREPLAGPLSVVVEFRLPMPKSRPQAVRDRGSAHSSKHPDIDKLLRSTFDGLTAGGAWGDDAQVSLVVASKLEVTGWTGAEITIATVGE